MDQIRLETQQSICQTVAWTQGESIMLVDLMWIVLSFIGCVAGTFLAVALGQLMSYLMEKIK
jgi:hypothetical protein